MRLFGKKDPLLLLRFARGLKKKFSFLFILGVQTVLVGLETKPWLGNPYEMGLGIRGAYSRFVRVQNASIQPSTPCNEYNFFFDLKGTIASKMDLQAELELAQTPKQPFNVRSASLQWRYQWLNDIAGDPLSVTWGLNVRAVPGHALKDVSCPYAANGNYAGTVAVGKEWSREGSWVMRTYGLGLIGWGNHGSPWAQVLFLWEKSWKSAYCLSLFSLGDFGLGNRQRVNVNRFYGWGPFSHQSIDVGASFSYQMAVWGTVSFSYAYRPFARNFPEHLQSVTMGYELPFSPF